ncbi:hypothetical protein D3C75_1008870 [compost metagenome]
MDSVNNLVFVNMAGQGQLDENPIDLLVAVQAFHQRQKLLFTGVLRQTVHLGIDAGCFTGLGFVAHINGRSRVIAHQHYRQSGLNLALGQFLHLKPEVLADGLNQFLAVNHLSRHVTPPICSLLLK